jgi:predicted RNA methylase
VEAIDLERPVRDGLYLGTVPGAVDYLCEELRLIDGVTITGRHTGGVRIDLNGPLSLISSIRYYSTVGVIMDAASESRLLDSTKTGALSAIESPYRFRVADIGPQRWPLRDELVASGWANEPGDWDVNITESPSGLVAELGALYWTRRFGELLRAPASTNPVIAAVMVRLAKVEPGQTLLDPCCGAGTLMVAAAEQTDAAQLIASDHDRHWSGVTATNLSRRALPATAPVTTVLRADMRALPLADTSIDRIVANLPFGKRVGSHAGNVELYPKVLSELARLLPRKGRAVLLTEDKRLFTQSVQRTRGIRVIKEITFTTGGAHPSAYVVTTRRTR